MFVLRKTTVAWALVYRLFLCCCSCLLGCIAKQMSSGVALFSERAGAMLACVRRRLRWYVDSLLSALLVIDRDYTTRTTP